MTDLQREERRLRDMLVILHRAYLEAQAPIIRELARIENMKMLLPVVVLGQLDDVH